MNRSSRCRRARPRVRVCRRRRQSWNRSPRTSVGPVNAFGGGVNAEIMYWMGGPDLNQLSKYSDTLLAQLRGMKALGVIDPDTNLITGKPELGVRIDRDKASDMGVRV